MAGDAPPAYDLGLFLSKVTGLRCRMMTTLRRESTIAAKTEKVRMIEWGLLLPGARPATKKLISSPSSASCIDRLFATLKENHDWK
jgi:hypothetical protein